MMRRVLITGVSGQDGLYLAAYLDRLGYEVIGAVQSGSEEERTRVWEFMGGLELVTIDMSDTVSLIRAISQTAPDEIYHLAAISSPRLAWREPTRAADVNGVGVLRLLEATRIAGSGFGQVRIFQASSAQMFGEIADEWFSEDNPIRPTTPYGASKAFGHFAAASYRKHYGAFVACGILGNHASPLQDEEFLLRRVAKAVTRISAGRQEVLELQNLDGVRDWGFAGDYVKAMHAMLQHERPEDFVIASGTTHTVAEAVATAFHTAGITDWQSHVKVASTDAGQTRLGAKGDISKARRLLGWVPDTDFAEVVKLMVEHEDRTGHSPPHTDPRGLPYPARSTVSASGLEALEERTG